MDEWLTTMFNSLGSTGGYAVNDLLKLPADYSPDLYHATILIHGTAVKPITAIVLAIMFVLMLATVSTQSEGDRELGVRIVAASMFKIAMVFIVAQNAPMFLDALASIAHSIATTANGIDVGAGGGPTAKLGDTLKADIADLGMVEKSTLLVLLILPWLVSNLAAVLAIVLVYVRFVQMYIMSAFASLPLAFIGHPETKSIGIGYLKSYAGVALTGTIIVITVKFYQALTGGFGGLLDGYDGNFTTFIFGSFGKFFVPPLVLIFLLLSANGLAKKILGEA